MLAGWSWWQIVLTVGVVWTAASFLVALALGRVLRANLAFDADAERAREPAVDDEGEEDGGAVWVGPTTMEPSLLDQLLPADLEEGPSRSSGTRFRPVASTTGVEQLRGQRRRIG